MIKSRLEEIESDIEVKEYMYTISYLKLWKVVKRDFSNDDDNNEGKKKELSVSINQKVAKAIEAVCELYHWEPERFIEKATEYWVKELKERIDDQELGFIVAFMDFSNALLAIKKAIKDD